MVFLNPHIFVNARSEIWVRLALQFSSVKKPAARPDSIGLSLVLLCPYNQEMAKCARPLNPAHRGRIF
jgi:hypothetical protein